MARWATAQRFSLRPEGGGWGFDAVSEMDGYDLPAEALVFVEAYWQTTWMRWPWGTVGALQPPANRALAEFDSPDDVLFRVRVTSPGTPEEPHGLLLAEADRGRSPEEVNDPRTPLLPVVPSHELGDLLWRIDFEDHPRLLINADAGDYKQIGLEPGFVAVVYPAALREVLERILHREKHRDFDDAAHPLSRWLRFAMEVLGVGEPPLYAEKPAGVLAAEVCAQCGAGSQGDAGAAQGRLEGAAGVGVRTGTEGERGAVRAPDRPRAA